MANSETLKLERRDRAIEDLIAVCLRMRPPPHRLKGIPDKEIVNLEVRAGTLREFIVALDAI